MYINSTIISTAFVALSSIVSKRTVVAPGTQLRILPLGASITVGFRSSDYNGYRQHLADRLSGSNVQYVGTIRAGTMKDNWNEGHSGYTIAQVQNSDAEALSERPNVILLHVGTNDLAYDDSKYPFAWRICLDKSILSRDKRLAFSFFEHTADWHLQLDLGLTIEVPAIVWGPLSIRSWECARMLR